MDSSTGMSKGPATKPQLIQPGHLQRRSLAQNLNKTTRLVAAGPLKATTQAASKKGETVERPSIFLFLEYLFTIKFNVKAIPFKWKTFNSLVHCRNNFIHNNLRGSFYGQGFLKI